VKSAAASGASRAQSAVDAVETAALAKIKLPTNFTLGARYYCIGFVNDRSCHKLPLNITSILSDIQHLGVEKFGLFSEVDKVLKHITPKTFESLVISGLACLTLVIVLFGIAIYRQLRGVFWAIFVVSMVCFSLFLTPPTIFYTLLSKAKNLFVQVEVGDIGKILIAVTCSAAVMFCSASFMVYCV
jgi:hypothetical protein